MRRTLVGAVLVTAVLSTGVAAGGDASSSSRRNGQIAFSRFDPRSSSGDTFVVTANPDGSRARRLSTKHACCPGYSHDGRKVAVSVGISGGRIGTATVGADGQDYRVLPLNDATLSAACQVWSPHDSRLACESWDDKHPSRNGVYTLSASNGGVPERLTSPPIGWHDEPGGYSPDGKRLVFSRFDKNNNPFGLFVINTDGSDQRRITPPGTILQVGNSGDWSPTRNNILFSRHTTAAVPGSIWIIGADGRHLREVKVQGLACGSIGCHEPHWSPDGKKIIFADTLQNGGNIYTVNADGSGLIEVARDGHDDNPAWGSHQPKQ